MKPVRSMISVPGHIQAMHVKAAKSHADVVMLDLEDSVPPDQKANARATVIKSLADIDWGRKTVAVRVNASDTRFAYKDVIHVVEAAGPIIDILVIPKVNSLKEIHFFSCLLDGIQMEKNMARDIRIQASIETAQGLEAVSAIAGASRRLHSLVFGIADYSASIGVGLTSVSGHGESDEEVYPGHRWHYPISKMVAAAKANNLLAIDATYGDFKDMEGLRRSTAMSRAIGCDGKWVIHPAQIDTVNQVFTPSEQEIARARSIMRFTGKIFKDGKFWLAEIPILDLMTQGRTKKETYEMVADMLESMVNKDGFKIEVFKGKREIFEVGASDPKPMVSLLLQRKRELSGLSLAQVATRLGLKSRNTYARYEQGYSVPSVQKLNELLNAVCPQTDIVINESSIPLTSK